MYICIYSYIYLSIYIGADWESLNEEDDEDELDGMGNDDLWSDEEPDDDGDGVVAEKEMEQFLRDEHNSLNKPPDRSRKGVRAGAKGTRPHSTPAQVTYLNIEDAAFNDFT